MLEEEELFLARQFRILFEIYRRPHAAFCRVLDEGTFLFALILALIVGVLFFGPVFNHWTRGSGPNTQAPSGCRSPTAPTSPIVPRHALAEQLLIAGRPYIPRRILRACDHQSW